MATKDEQTARLDFSQRYAAPTTDVMGAIERAVIGADWGANGYTTVAEADLLARRLRLSSSMRLLDIGTGRGWPGLYLAKKTGCEVVVTDLPIEGMLVAEPRARREGVALIGGVVSSARRLPFRPRTFDAIVHTDVLC